MTDVKLPGRTYMSYINTLRRRARQTDVESHTNRPTDPTVHFYALRPEITCQLMRDLGDHNGLLAQRADLQG